MYLSCAHSAYLLGWRGTAGAEVCSLGMTMGGGSVAGAGNAAGVGSPA